MDIDLTAQKHTNPLANDWDSLTVSYDSTADTVTASLTGADADKFSFSHDPANETVSFKVKSGMTGKSGKTSLDLILKVEEDGTPSSHTATGQIQATYETKVLDAIDANVGNIEGEIGSTFKSSVSGTLESDGDFELSNVNQMGVEYSLNWPINNFETSLTAHLKSKASAMPQSANHSYDVNASVGITGTYSPTEDTYIKAGVNLKDKIFADDPDETHTMDFEPFADLGATWNPSGSSQNNAITFGTKIEWDVNNPPDDASWYDRWQFKPYISIDF